MFDNRMNEIIDIVRSYEQYKYANTYQEYSVRENSITLLLRKIGEDNNKIITDLRIIDMMYKYLDDGYGKPNDKSAENLRIKYPNYNTINPIVTINFLNQLNGIKFIGLSGSKLGTNFITFDQYIKNVLSEKLGINGSYFDVIDSNFHFIILSELGTNLNFVTEPESVYNDSMELFIIKKGEKSHIEELNNVSGTIFFGNNSVTVVNNQAKVIPEFIKLREYINQNVTGKIIEHLLLTPKNVNNTLQQSMLPETAEKIIKTLNSNPRYNKYHHFNQLTAKIIKSAQYNRGCFIAYMT